MQPARFFQQPVHVEHGAFNRAAGADRLPRLIGQVEGKEPGDHGQDQEGQQSAESQAELAGDAQGPPLGEHPLHCRACGVPGLEAAPRCRGA